MKQKKKKDEQQSHAAAADEQQQQLQQQQQQMQQKLCNGGGELKLPKKSALKRTATGGSKSRSSSKNKRHVQFNESQNVFFESDYVIVIRDDDCDFDEEDFDFWSQHPCSCGDESCFQPWMDDDDGGGGRGLPPLEPYEEQPATLSPPDGYKDGCPRHVPPSLDHLKYDDDLNTRYNSDVMDRCSDTHVAIPYNSIANSTSYFDDNNQKVRPDLASPPRTSKEELQQQQQQQQQQHQPPTNSTVLPQLSKPNTVCDINSSTAQQPRCIVETITMTTVTERQIVQQETRPADMPGVTTASAAASAAGAKPADDPKTGGTGATATAAAAAGAAPAPDDGYVMIKCGNSTVLYNNRNPNSAVRQLFPATKFVCPPTRIKETDDARLLNKYLITEESLRAFDSRSYNGGLGGSFRGELHSDDDDDDTSNSLIRRTIERSTLRRNTAKKKNFNDGKEISLIEKIRRLTCDSDEDADAADDAAAKKSTQEQSAATAYTVLVQCESGTPSSASSSAPAYKKLTDLFGGSGGRYDQPLLSSGGDPTGKPDPLDLCDGHAANRATARGSGTGGKPFLSTLATACVTGNVHPAAGGGVPLAAGTVQQQQQPQSQCPQPDVVAGTQAPSSHCRQEELAAFVQQDSGRLEKIRKRYMPPAAGNNANSGAAADGDDEDDENDDYGFNRRPEVHGIRSGFSAQITIKNNQQPPQRPRSYYGGGDQASRQSPGLEAQPDFVPRYPAAVASVRARIQGDPRGPPPYPAAAQRSIIRVTHGQQQQTIRVPYQAVGPVQVHLLTTAATANVGGGVGGHGPAQVQFRHPANEYIVQHGHARIHHGEQLVFARGTQTAAISTTRYYQLPPPLPPNNIQQQQPSAAAAAVATDDGPTLQFKQTSPTRAMAGSTRLHLQQQQHHHHQQQQHQQQQQQQQQEYVDQAPKNPVQLFYGM